MSDRSVRDLLTQLHAALSGTPRLGDEDRALLQQLASDIQATLARSGPPAGAEHATLVARLQEAVTRFEVSHPNLTTAMALAAKRLGDMGI